VQNQTAVGDTAGEAGAGTVTVGAGERATTSEAERSVPRPWLRWLGRGLWAVTDQGLFAISHFAINVLFARWLPPREYGAFATGYSLFILLSTVHTGLFTEPMLIFGSGKYAPSFAAYLRILLRSHGWFSVGAGALLAIAGLALLLGGSAPLAHAVWSLIFAAPCILLTWLLRRACYARLRPGVAAAGGALYLLLVVVGALLLKRAAMLSVATAFALLGIAGLVVGLWLAARLRTPTEGRAPGVATRAVLRDHWEYGRWAVASNALSWAPSNLYYLALPLRGGLEASAALKALMNLAMPALQANDALTTLLLPVLVRARAEAATFRRALRAAGVIFTASSAAYLLFLVALGRPLAAWMYGGRYQGDAALFWLLGLLPLAAGVVHVFAAALRALERPDQVFWGHVLAAACTVSLGLWAAFVWGARGAIAGMVLASLIRGALMVRLLPRAERDAAAGRVRGSSRFVMPVSPQ
jgi:O-antigen/teichoic acid export membrane protein